MPKSRNDRTAPPCYAMVHPGLENVAGDEIAEIDAVVKHSGAGIVVFLPHRLDSSILQLRTTEDVFLLAWGTDSLSLRAKDLAKITEWTERNVNWKQLLQWHHSVRTKPKGKPSYRLVVQMAGKHVYRRIDAHKALAKGLAGKLPGSWKHADENAAVEIWLTIQQSKAVCGLRLSDRTMRHRTYKDDHLPGSLRPTVAAAMARLAELRQNDVVLDPMCGGGTVLAETCFMRQAKGAVPFTVIGGDIHKESLRIAAQNLRRWQPIQLFRWTANRLPLANNSVDRLLCNLPFGKKIQAAEGVEELYRDLAPEWNRALKRGGRAVLLVGDAEMTHRIFRRIGWRQTRKERIRILGQPSAILVYGSER